MQAQDQGAAAKLWAEVDRDATNLAAVVPTYTPRNIDLVSKRVGNYQHHPLFGVLLDQLWVAVSLVRLRASLRVPRDSVAVEPLGPPLGTHLVHRRHRAAPRNRERGNRVGSGDQ